MNTFCGACPFFSNNQVQNKLKQLYPSFNVHRWYFSDENMWAITAKNHLHFLFK